MRQARVPYDGLSSEGVQRISAAADGLGVARVAGLCAPRRAPARAHQYRSSSRYQPLPPERRHPQDAMGLPVECQTHLNARTAGSGGETSADQILGVGTEIALTSGRS